MFCHTYCISILNLNNTISAGRLGINILWAAIFSMMAILEEKNSKQLNALPPPFLKKSPDEQLVIFVIWPYTAIMIVPSMDSRDSSHTFRVCKHRPLPHVFTMCFLVVLQKQRYLSLRTTPTLTPRPGSSKSENRLIIFS